MNRRSLLKRCLLAPIAVLDSEVFDIALITWVIVMTLALIISSVITGF